EGLDGKGKEGHAHGTAVVPAAPHNVSCWQVCRAIRRSQEMLGYLQYGLLTLADDDHVGSWLLVANWQEVPFRPRGRIRAAEDDRIAALPRQPSEAERHAPRRIERIHPHESWLRALQRGREISLAEA